MRRWGHVVATATVIACAGASACSSIVSLDSVDPADGGTETTSTGSSGKSSSGAGKSSTSGASGTSTTSSTSSAAGGTSTSTSSSSSSGSSGTTRDAGDPSATVDAGPSDPQVTCAQSTDCEVNQNNKVCRQDNTCATGCVGEGADFACDPIKQNKCCLGFHCTVKGQIPFIQDVCVAD